MKKIILPTDFSKNAQNAMAYAIELFKQKKCAFYLMNTFLPSAHYDQQSWHVGLEPSSHQKSMKQLTGLLNRLSKNSKNPDHLFIPHSAMNSVVGEIKKLVQEEQIDLIVMGKQGETGVKNILFGSNTTEVIKEIKHPVITVPSNFKYKAPKNILFATDYEISYSKEQLKELLHIAEDHRSHIAVLHVSNKSGLTIDQQSNKAMLVEVLAEVDHLLNLVPHQDVRSAINDYQVDQNMDFLVMIQNKHTFMERLFLTSNIKKIALEIKVPFMVISCPSKNPG